MSKVLYLTLHRAERSPSQRFRFEQYMEFLKQNGFDYKFSYLLDADDDKIFYSPRNYFAKAVISVKSIFRRIGEAINANDYDIIFVQRECFMLGTAIFEKLFARSKAKLIFDFDDSIWMQNVSDANKKLAFLKNAEKTSEIIRVADLIFAGNPYLRDYAKQFNKNIAIIPTTIDTEEYKPVAHKNDGTVCIGWSGSITTIQHFKYAIPALEIIKKKYGERISIKVIGDGNYKNEALNVIALPWIKADEVKEISSFDIGIMPLPDDEWAKGKCGLKGLQYMALEVPTIMSPVGVNSEIIRDGENGFLATTTEEWVDKTSRLIESEELRNKVGKAARQTVIEKYSVEALKPVYLSEFRKLLNA